MNRKGLFGRYEILKHIGEGSNGTVYKVRDMEQNNIRAVKVLAGYVEDKSSPKYGSFLKEYRRLAQLGNCVHPNIVNVHWVDLYNNQAYYEMDYVNGKTLRKYLVENTFLPMDEVYHCIHDILSATSYAHVDVHQFLYDREKDEIPADPNDGSKVNIDDKTRDRLVRSYGIVHNDIHSSNIMRNSYDGRYVLLDFGISLQGDDAVRKSGLGDGALEYMAPEKMLNDTVNFRTDVYSIGVVLYEVLTGNVPYPTTDDNGHKRTRMEMYQIVTGGMIPNICTARASAFASYHREGVSYEKDYPDWLVRMILKCLEVNPEKRYANAKEIFEEYQKHMEHTLNDYNENLAKAQMLDDAKEKLIKEQEMVRSQSKEIETLKKENVSLKHLLGNNVKRAFAWTLVVALAIAVAIIYFPLLS